MLKREKGNGSKIALMISEVKQSIGMPLLPGAKDSVQRAEEKRTAELQV